MKIGSSDFDLYALVKCKTHKKKEISKVMMLIMDDLIFKERSYHAGSFDIALSAIKLSIISINSSTESF